MVLAAFLIIGHRVWPAVFLGALMANLPVTGSSTTAAGIAVASTFHGVLGNYLFARFARPRTILNNPVSLFEFTVLGLLLSTTVSATYGVACLSLCGYTRWSDFGSAWLTWWLADLAVDLVLAPFLLAWCMRRAKLERRGNAFEAVLLLGALLLVSQAMFGGLFPSHLGGYPLEFLCAPILLWAAFCFRQRDVTTAVLLISGSAICGVMRGFGRFPGSPPSESLVILQAYIGVASVMTLMLAVVVSEQQQVTEELRYLSTTDSLTGIANYRQLIDRLQAEIERSQRTVRPFAVLFLDLDGMKSINDQYGHMVGNRALCRVVEALRLSCRAIDTPARFGGDEFVVVLPETDEAAARQVRRRIIDRVACDREIPLISVSIGVAVYPNHAETLDALLGSADRSLYEMKSCGKESKEAIVP
jgi:diguanylate cyclase (GGDEF)-like protein